MSVFAEQMENLRKGNFSPWSVSDLVNSSEIDWSLPPYLDIKKILWQMDEISDLPWQEDLPSLSVHLYKTGAIGDVDFYSLIKLLFINELIPEDFLQHFVLYFEGELVVADFLSSLSDWAYILVLPAPQLSNSLDFYESQVRKIPKNTRAEYERIDSKVYSLEKKRDQFYEHIDEFPSPELEGILPHLNFADQSRITQELLGRYQERLSGDSWDTLMRSSSSLPEFWQEFPPSFSVLGGKIAVLPPQTLEMDVMASIPQNKVQEWAPKFVYSQPELQEKIQFYFPGGYNIGHSAILVKTNHGLVLMDFGMSVINNRIPQWHPLLEKVDAILVSHAHLDHSGGLPVLLRAGGALEKTPWFGTKETNILCEMLFNDTRNVLRRTWPKGAFEGNFMGTALTSEANIINSLGNFNEVGLKETFTLLPNFNVTPHSAGHLFGSVGYDIQIGNKTILYTGDFNNQAGALFPGSQYPKEDYNHVIFDGTNLSKPESTAETQDLQSIAANSERILIPAFAMGRTQEVLYQVINAGLDKTHKVIITGMGGRLLKKLGLKINSKNITIAPTILDQEFDSKTVVITGNGMLQGGTSRNLLNYTKDDLETAVVFTGYQSPNTMGNALLSQSNKWLEDNYKQQITKVSISGHTSRSGLEDFLSGFSKEKTVVHAPKEVNMERIRSLGLNHPSEVVGKEY